MLFKDLISILKTPLGVSEATLKLPFVDIKFKPSDILDLEKTQRRVEEILTDHFIRRRAMWWDLTAERYDYVESSLKELGEQLTVASRSFDVSHKVLYYTADRWATEAVLVAKELLDKLTEIQAEKNANFGSYDSAGEDRHEACIEALKGLRLRTYPLVDTLIQVLADDSPIRSEAERIWLEGANMLRPSEILCLKADWSISIMN